MKHLQPLKSLFLMLMLSVCLASCSKDDMDNNDNFTSITVKLKSVTAELNKVYIDIQDVQIKVNANESPEAWLSLNTINQGTYNACDLRESNPLLLVDDFEIQADYVYEIRLVLGDNNFMDINNVLHSLDVESLGNAKPSNLIDTQLNPKRRYDVIVELDIDESISFNEAENMMVLNPKLYTLIRQIEY